MVAARLLPRGRRRLKDLIELLLLDAKSGSARSPNTQSRRRLQQAMRNHRIGYAYVSYRKGKVNYEFLPEEAVEVTTKRRERATQAATTFWKRKRQRK